VAKTRRRNLDVLTAWLDAGRRADREAMLALLAPGAAWQGIRPEWRAETPEAVVEMWLERAAALDDAEGFERRPTPVASRCTSGRRRWRRSTTGSCAASTSASPSTTAAGSPASRTT
jgi:hypothetical protein